MLKPGKKAAISVVGPRSNEFTWLNGIFQRNKSVDVEGVMKFGR